MQNPFKGQTQNPLAVLSDVSFEVFLNKIGSIFFNAPAAAALARHKKPLNTIKDYLDSNPNDELALNLAKEYVQDVLSMDTEGLARKWYGKGAHELARDTANLLEENR